MTSKALLGWFIIGATLGTYTTMLYLQIRALLRHKHISFLILSVASLIGIISELITLATIRFLQPGESTPLWLDVIVVGLLPIQMLLTIWGTVKLFGSYGVIADALESSRRAASSV
jgi:hypothetical protein